MRTGRTGGFTLIELLIVVATIGVLAAITVPDLLRARMSSNEASAIGSLRAIVSGEATYSSSCGHGAYAQTLDDLALAPNGTTEGFISPDLAANGVTKSGYLVTLGRDATASDIGAAGAACNNNTSTTVSSYFAEDHPLTVGNTGQRSFATDTRGTVYFLNTGAAIAAGMAGATALQ